MCVCVCLCVCVRAWVNLCFDDVCLFLIIVITEVM